MPESRQHTLDRVRKPRVHITYDVEVGDATVKKELPFIVGVMGDFSGDNLDKTPLENRKFINIDRVNFDEVMARLAPSVNLRVENTLQGDGSEMAVELKFRSMEDFNPAKIVQQVEPLRKLLEARDKLSELRANADRKQELEAALEEILQNTDKMTALAGELGLSNSSASKKETDQ